MLSISADIQIPIHKWKWLLLLPGLLFFVFNSSWAQNEASYLDTLKDEAAELSLDKSTESAAPSAGLPTPVNPLTAVPVDNQAGAIEDFVSGLSLQQFEDLLKHNYMGSYLFYKRLGQQQKNTVYEFYLQNPDPNQVRQKILQINKTL